MTEQEFVEGVQRTIHSLTWYLIHERGRTYDDAIDIVQTAIEVLYKKHQTIEGHPFVIRAWLKKAVNYGDKSLARRLAKVLFVPLPTDAEIVKKRRAEQEKFIDQHASQEDVAASHEVQQMVNRVLQGFQRDIREALLRHYGLDVPLTHIATDMGTSRKQLSSMLKPPVMKLRKRLEPYRQRE